MGEEAVETPRAIKVLNLDKGFANNNQPPVKQNEGGGGEGDGIVVDFNEGNDTPPAPEKETPEQKKSREEAAAAAPKYSSRFKDFVGKDEFGEDDIFDSLSKRDSELKATKQKLATVVEGKKRLQNDKQYQNWNGFLKETPDKLVEMSLAYDYAEDGSMTSAQAQARAKERIEEETKNNKNFVEDYARNIRKDIRNSLASREQEILTEIENASKDINFVEPSKEFESKVQESQSKIDKFVGLTLPKDEKERKKLISQAYIDPKSMSEALKDPDFYNKVCLLKKYEKQFTKAVESRTNGKSKVIEKLPKQPSLGSGLQTKKPVRQENGQRPAFNGKTFLGR